MNGRDNGQTRRNLPLWRQGEPLFEEARALQPKTVAVKNAIKCGLRSLPTLNRTLLRTLLRTLRRNPYSDTLTRSTYTVGRAQIIAPPGKTNNVRNAIYISLCAEFSTISLSLSAPGIIR